MAGRPRTTARATTIRIPSDIAGWVDYAAHGAGGLSAYLWSLVRADRERAMADPATAHAYRAHLVDMGMELVGVEVAEDFPTITDPREAVSMLRP